MNFGQNLLTWLQGQLLPIFLIIVIGFALTMAIKRQFTALIGGLILLGIVGVLVSTPNSLLQLGKKLWNVVFA